MDLKFSRYPTCEACGLAPANHFSLVAQNPREKSPYSAASAREKADREERGRKRKKTDPRPVLTPADLSAYAARIPRETHWKFVCSCDVPYEQYAIDMDSFFASPTETADWLAHLGGKETDWVDFCEMMRRFREKIGYRDPDE